MDRRGLRAACCLIGMGVARAVQAQADADPRTGAWEELKTSTRFESIRRVVVPIADDRMRMTINAKLGEENRIHIDFRCDGQSYPFVDSRNVPTGLLYACRRIDARSVESRLSRANPPAGAETRVTETVSADGTQLSMVITSHGTDGKTETTHRNFSRVSD